MNTIFLEISLVIVLAGTLGIIMHVFRQPAIVGYVLTGLIIGPLGYHYLNDTETLHALSQIGITLLLFMVGLELSLKDLKHIGPTVLLVGFGQVALMTSLSTWIFSLFGYDLQTAVFLGLGLGFSSTIIAVKMLSEKKDLDSLYGKLVLGILVVEDLFAVLAATLLSVSGSVSIFSPLVLLMVVGKLLALGAIALITGRYALPWVVEKLGKSQELLFLFSLAWGLGFATLLADYVFHVNSTIGGFLAGLALASSPQHFHIANKMKPLRDFFLILFFIVLGSQLMVDDWQKLIIYSLGFLVLGAVIKPMFTFLFLTLAGYKGRTSFMTASSLAHISEFSIILALLGWQTGRLSRTAFSTVTLAAILSYVFAAYVLAHNHQVARLLRRFLGWWDPKTGGRENDQQAYKLKNHVVLVGAHRTGLSVLRSLEDLERPYIVVDFNPAVVKQLKTEGLNTLFGDITDPEIQELANLTKAKLIISTVPDYQDGLALQEALRGHYPKPKLIVSASSDWEAKKLYAKGVDYVLMPHFLTGLQLAQLLKKDYDLKDIRKLKERDLKLIEVTS